MTAKSQPPSRLLAAGALLSILIAGCAGSRPAAVNGELTWSAAELAIERAMGQPEQAHAFWTAAVVDLNTGRTIYNRDADRNMIPASNTKLYTTAAALEVLGPDFRFETRVVTDGEVTGDTLRGNLIVVGSGDPSIGGRFRDGDELAIFREWGQALKEIGISHVEGDIIGDDNLFDDQALGYGWSWDDEVYWYSAELSALSFNDNCIDLTVVGGAAVGEPATITWRPLNTSYVTVENSTRTVLVDSLADERYSRKRAQNHIVVSSDVAAGSTDRESLSVTNPTLFFVHVLRDVLEDVGISVDGFVRDIDDTNVLPDYDEHRVLIRHESEPLSDLVAVVNKRSHNLYADQLLKVLGTLLADDETDEPGGSAENGLTVAANVWGAAGVDTSTVNLVDGSGLSRYNLTSARATAALLTYMWTRPEPVRSAFVSSLPIGGIDGTLSGRYPDGRARGLVRAKTGTLSNVSALGGYVNTARGTPLAFTIMSNGFVVDTDEIRAVQDEVVSILASVFDR